MKIVKFVQPSCQPCRMVEGLMNHLNLKEDQKVDLALDENATELVDKYGIMSTPTLILIDDEGNLVDRVSGTNKEAIESLFAKRG